MSGPLRGIPTTFDGVRMRSRLEARWAAMFNSLGWVWEYEPFDLVGYIPDFLVHFQRGDMLFEVKGPLEQFEPARAKIECSLWESEVVLVGDSITTPTIGQMVDLNPSLPGHEWGGCKVFFCLSCGEHSICNDDNGWTCRRCGETEGHVGEMLDLEQRWKDAGTRIQWRAA